MTEREIYKKVRDRYKWHGTITDASIIVKQEEEIEYYRGIIEELKKALEEAEEKFSQMFDSKNETIRELKKDLEESSKKTVRIGDTITVEGESWKVTFKLLNCIVHTGTWVKGYVELCGTLIEMERVRSE